jgi:sulfotransferase family protein
VPRQPAELIPRIPDPVRAVPRNLVWAYGTATSALRPLPDALIIGAQKAGTTALYAYLRRHPQILGPSWKEVSYFDRHYRRGEAWYRGHFPNDLRVWFTRRRGLDPIVAEASTGYVFHPLGPERVAKLIPEVRLIALVRDPVDRAYSHYQHEVALGRERLTFEEAIEREDERMEGEVERMLADPAYFSYAWWNYTYLARGRYAEQLERWLELFPREQLLVVPTDDLRDRPADTYALVLDHIGAESHELDDYPRIFSREYSEMRPETRRRLSEYYSEPNRRLYELLERDLEWT